MLEGIPHIATIKGVSATDREINDNDRYNEILEEDYPNKESNIIPNIETGNTDLDNNMSVNDTKNDNLEELSTSTDDSYNTDEKENRGTTANNEINNINEEESNIPLYQQAQQPRCSRRNQNLDLLIPFKDDHISEAILSTKTTKTLLELMINDKPLKKLITFILEREEISLKKQLKNVLKTRTERY